MDLNLKKYNKIGIMGGTFDPIHNQHLFIANTALTKLNLDIVLFIPTGISPHKDTKKTSSNLDRYNMTQLAINSNPKFFITDIETSNNKINYTFETLQKIKEQTDATLYVIIGLDTLYTLHTWKNLDIIGKLCKIVNFERPNYIESNENKNIIEKYNLEIINIPDLSVSISSSEIRQKLINNEPVKYIIPDNVIDYIKKMNLYKENYEDLIDHIKLDIKNKLSSNRYNHTISVMEFAEKLALLYDEDVNKIKVSALLHDYAKEMTKEESLKYISENNLHIDDFTLNNMEIVHGFIGADIALKKFKITDENILNSIYYHTITRPNMSNIEKIIYLADKLDPTRQYDSLAYLTDLAFKNLDLALCETLRLILEYNKQRGLNEHPLTIVAYEYYKKLIKEKN